MDKLVNEVDISVIVPIYNVEEYLEKCLESILNQTKDNIEVIMVDDGSTDGSSEIAKQFADEHPGFHYYYKENGGLGCARNYGVQYARGEYIAFIDSDDVIAWDMYEKLYTYAKRNNSDMAICNVVRFNRKSVWASSLHQLLFRGINESCTHITKCPSLIYDTTSWNKLIRRSFYVDNGFSFPENILYEDIPVTIPMHFKANNVSVVESTYYYWRVRDGASKSITQNTDNLDNLNDRIKVLKMVDEFFEKNNIDECHRRVAQKKTLEIDLMIFINNCKSIPAELADEVFTIVNRYIDEAIDESVLKNIPLIYQEKYTCAREHNIERLISLLEYQYSCYYNAPVTEKDGRFYMTAPDDIFTFDNRDITDELIHMEPKKYISNIVVGSNKIEIYSHIYKSRVNINDFSEQKITAYLENEFTENIIELPVTPVKNSQTTEDRGTVFDPSTEITSNYNYDGTGFKIDIDLNELDINENNQGYNKILICYENRLSSGKLRLGSTSKLTNDSAVLLGDNYARLEYDALKEVRIYLNRSQNFADKLSMEGPNVVIELENDAKSIWTQNEDGEIIEFETKDNKKFTLSSAHFDDDRMYYLHVTNSDGSDGKLLYRHKKIIIKKSEDKIAVFRASKNHCLRFSLMDSITVVGNMVDAANNVVLKTTGSSKNPDLLKAKYAQLYVDDSIAGERVILAKSKCRIVNDKAVCIFAINFNNREITKNLYKGMRDVFISYKNDDGEISSELIYSRKFHKAEMNFSTLELSLYRGVNGNIRLKSAQVWKANESTQQKRKALTAKNYPKYRKEKINNKRIIFESMWGAKYSCNPQHLYEYIDKNYPEFECIWSLNDEHTPIKGNGIRVRRGSQEYYKYLATAKYFVNNVNFETDYVKRDGQIEIQTMHGTPLKTLGLDVKGDFPNESSKRLYLEKNGRWNYLTVQGQFMENKAYDCFNFDKEILKYGYPRTDVLFNVTDQKREDIKKSLGLPLDKKIILYTPTWRSRGSFDMQLDLDKMREKLSDEYILLVRLHHLCAPKDSVEADNKFIFDLHSYRCVEDLYIISDILITDYSSVMFDYALLDKPMLFFTYDLEDYRDNLRGLYVDIEEEAPGPLLFDTDEVIAAIDDIDAQMDKCADKISAFKEKYLNYENGDSCKRIVEEVFQINPVAHKYAQYKRKAENTIKKLFKKGN